MPEEGLDMDRQALRRAAKEDVPDRYHGHAAELQTSREAEVPARDDWNATEL